jgi:hypothetical protein
MFTAKTEKDVANRRLKHGVSTLFAYYREEPTTTGRNQPGAHCNKYYDDDRKTGARGQ